jgi:hypothetical protein
MDVDAGRFEDGLDSCLDCLARISVGFERTENLEVFRRV